MGKKRRIQNSLMHSQEYEEEKAHQVHGIWGLTIVSEAAVAVLAAALTIGLVPGGFPDIFSFLQKQEEPALRTRTDDTGAEEPDYSDYTPYAEEYSEPETTEEPTPEATEESTPEPAETTPEPTPETEDEPDTDPSETPSEPETVPEESHEGDESSEAQEDSGTDETEHTEQDTEEESE